MNEFSRETVEAMVRRLGGTIDQRRSAILRHLSKRRFPAGWWHADDTESAVDVMRAGLADLGLDPTTAANALAHRRHESGTIDAEEDMARRHQIGAVARAVNVNLAASGDTRRLYAFDEATCADESDEPAWMLLAEEERTALLAACVLVPVASDTVEAGYDPIAAGGRAG
jgi:hypothetical protein